MSNQPSTQPLPLVTFEQNISSKGEINRRRKINFFEKIKLIMYLKSSLKFDLKLFYKVS